MNHIPYGRQHITNEDIEAVIEVLQSEFLTQGPAVEDFEKAFANYIGVDYAIAVSNGTAALHLSALALEVNSNSKVITSPITFAASANCVTYCNGEVVFADIDPESYLIDINKVRKILEASSKGSFSGIIPVDFAGYPVKLNEFRELADEFGLWLLEDACHAPGGYFSGSDGKNYYCGSGKFADLSIFSFHPVKHIAAGEGGMITTNNVSLYKKLYDLRNHGITKNPNLLMQNHGGWYYEMQNLGYNYRLSDIQAALGLSQLSRAEIGLKRRHEIARNYDKAFENTKLTIPIRSDDVYHAFHLYVVLVDERKALYDYLREAKIYSQVHYIPVHLQPYYQKLGWKEGDFPIAEKYYKQCLSLPMYPLMTDDEQQYVIEKVLAFLNE